MCIHGSYCPLQYVQQIRKKKKKVKVNDDEDDDNNDNYTLKMCCWPCAVGHVRYRYYCVLLCGTISDE